MDPAVVSQPGVLRAALPAHDEQGGERGEDEEPIGEWHVGHHPAGNRPQHEARRHNGKLHNGFSLQSECVGDAQPGVRGHHDG